ncbi:MAG TPA: PqqD family protein [Gemmatimonadaceae bacterium]
MRQGGRTVVVDFRHGRYYGLDEVAARLWALVESAASVEEMVRAIGDEYDATPELIDRDVRTFLRQLQVAGLATWQ